MDAKRVAELARQAYSEDARAESPSWEYSDITESLMKTFDPVFLRFAELLQQELEGNNHAR